MKRFLVHQDNQLFDALFTKSNGVMGDTISAVGRLCNPKVGGGFSHVAVRLTHTVWIETVPDGGFQFVMKNLQIIQNGNSFAMATEIGESVNSAALSFSGKRTIDEQAVLKLDRYLRKFIGRKYGWISLIYQPKFLAPYCSSLVGRILNDAFGVKFGIFPKIRQRIGHSGYSPNALFRDLSKVSRTSSQIIEQSYETSEDFFVSIALFNSDASFLNVVWEEELSLLYDEANRIFRNGDINEKSAMISRIKQAESKALEIIRDL